MCVIEQYFNRFNHSKRANKAEFNCLIVNVLFDISFQRSFVEKKYNTSDIHLNRKITGPVENDFLFFHRVTFCDELAIHLLPLSWYLY